MGYANGLTTNVVKQIDFKPAKTIGIVGMLLFVFFLFVSLCFFPVVEECSESLDILESELLSSSEELDETMSALSFLAALAGEDIDIPTLGADEADLFEEVTYECIGIGYLGGLFAFLANLTGFILSIVLFCNRRIRT